MPPNSPRRHAGARGARRLLATLGGALAVAVVGGPVEAATASGPPLVITTGSLPAAEVGQTLAIQLGASGGTTPLQWLSSSLPAGVTMTSGGLLGGSPTSPGNQTVAVSVVDASNQRVNASLTLDVAPGPSVTTTSLTGGQVGQSYSVQLSEANGTAPFTWSVGTGPLPGGMVLSSSGLFSGRPGTPGTSSIDVEVTDAAGSRAQAVLTLDVLPPPLPPEGYVTVDAAGASTIEGIVAPASLRTVPGSTVALAVEPAGSGYWSVTSQGSVHPVGGARFFGSVGRRHLRGRIVGIAAPAGGTGYWVVGSTGHVYGFGAEHSIGSVPKKRLRGRVVGIAASPTGRGYWVVSSSGQVFAFGSAQHLGSVPAAALQGRVVGIAAMASGTGYWLVTASGHVYGFGAAQPLPAVSGIASGTVVSIAAAPVDAGPGYWLLTRSGAVYAFGGARAVGTSSPPPVGGLPTAVPSVAIAGAR